MLLPIIIKNQTLNLILLVIYPPYPTVTISHLYHPIYQIIDIETPNGIIPSYPPFALNNIIFQFFQAQLEPPPIFSFFPQ